ncbi:RNA-binding protein 26-like isoform X2 [Xenia sp. Carnegie-2017]|uniref:RNA-binding protein 26-like isoform X2 n=1 Tax=Xenia sp. Carnegie-2017 TaxID=2897299 RepID=UPI001F03D745|nr:RNA-binding protein 26-like isoform X2 [Xenia sp. Carnegie-2017]
MLLKNLDALKIWLTARLEKICDADPGALAKYVVALLKKDKPLGDLEEICIDQLEVFLGRNTVSFVKTLFEALKNNSYIPVAPKSVTPLLNETSKQVTPPMYSLSTTPEPTNAAPESNVSKQISPPKLIKQTGENEILPGQASGAKPGHFSTKDNVSLQHLNKPPSPRPDNKRVLSTDESFRPQAEESSVLDEDDRDFKRTRKPVEEVEEREEKPILTIHRDTYQSSQRAKKRRSESDRDISAPRVKVLKNEPTEDIKDEFAKNKNKDEGMDEDITKRKDGKEQSSKHNLADKTRESSSDRENSQRTSDKGKPRHEDRPSAKSRLYKSRPWGKRGRCRDYDEKGYCMRGELCLYDHGNDPLIVGSDPMNIPGIVLGFQRAPHPAAFISETAGLNPTGLTMRPAMPHIPYPVRPAAHVTANVRVPTSAISENNTSRSKSDESRTAVAQTPIANVRPNVAIARYKDVIPSVGEMYNPEQPSFDGRQPEKPSVWARLGMQSSHIANMHIQRGRELVQVMTAQVPSVVSSTGAQDIKNTATAVKGANITTVPPTAGSVPEQSNPPTTNPPPRRYTNTVLEVKKLPPNLNNIATLNAYFQRFGKIVNIQVSAFGQSDMALIQFSTNFEARAAISCADAILGNRFIRIFWHKPDLEQQKNDRKVQLENNKTAVSNAKPIVNDKPAAPIMFQTGQTTFKSAVLSTAVEKKKHSTAKVVKDVVKKKVMLQKQKQELLCKQIENQKLLIKKLEQTKNLKPADKEQIMQTLKIVSESVSKLQNEVKVSAALVRSKESPARARQVAQKELLDRELDLITHEQTGEDTTELRHRVEELKKEAQSLGLLDANQRGGGRGRGRGGRIHLRSLSRGSGARGRSVVSRSAAVVDNRPKVVVVESYNLEKKNLVKQRLKVFGEIEQIEEENEGRRLVVTYHTRKQAESAIAHVSSLNMDVTVCWQRRKSISALHETPVNVKSSIGSEEELVDSENALDAETEEMLLEGHMDDEDDEEERTWRR